MTDFRRIGIVGAGAWGTALANAIASNERAVVLYARAPAIAAEMKKSRTNASRLPGIALNAEIIPTNALADAAEADVILVAVPAQSLRETSRELAPAIRNALPVIACAKGIERGTDKFATEVLAEAIPLARPAILSGPCFATDVGRGLPTAVTLAASEDDLAADLAEALSSHAFRLYHSTDVRGVEIGGAAKNVLAIAAGIVFGRGLGASAQAALITRGFAELSRLGRAFDVRPETLMGLSGLGDLILTCSSPQSRNYAFGFAIGRGQKPSEAARGALVEGLFTAPVLADIAEKKRVEMPIIRAVNAVLTGRANVDTAIMELLSRPLKSES
ncbi:MAG TPA: NAD(P)H-dependent glycerol-3-phosphate dehydrogenase [Xanthobacteraceae bacterium]|nr:NAD(P)H-dependent glycerol-3-phosphate dehydrogenase [Xanthobacteraceae bacterium]